MTPIFDEREAIRLELQELIDQKRMDYDLYLESRKIRNDRTIVLLDRLRELDGWKAPTVEKVIVPPSREEEFKELMKIKPAKTVVEKAREHTRNTGPNKSKIYVPLEKVAPLITRYLIENGPSAPKDIQKFVQDETGGKWGNFTNPLVRSMEKFGNIKRGERGLYYYEDGGENEKTGAKKESRGQTE